MSADVHLNDCILENCLGTKSLLLTWHGVCLGNLSP